MFRSRRIIRRISLLLSLLVLTAMAASAQVEKTRTQTPATTPVKDVSPLVVGRGSDSKESSHVMPLDPVVRILRLMGFNAVEDHVVVKPENGFVAEPIVPTLAPVVERIVEPVTDPFAVPVTELDRLLLLFCGSHGISPEEFAALYQADLPPAVTQSPPSQKGMKNTVATKNHVEP